MPYIEKSLRADWNFITSQLKTYFIMNIVTPGVLNYLITEVCQLYLQKKGESYRHYNDIVGVLDCVKQELYRRRIIPYEDKKIKENGDVYGPKYSIKD